VKSKKNTRDSKLSTKNIFIPSYIFKDRSVAVLEVLVEYLKEQKGYSYHEMAVLLNRDDRTIWTVYNRTTKKREKTPRKDYSQASTNTVEIPSKIFQDRTVAVLEIIVEFLKEKKAMTYHEIAMLLNRDDRTIWTVYNRCQKKRANERAR